MAVSRRTALASGVLAVVGGGLALLLVWWLWLPGAARRHVEDELATRLGLDAQIGELSIGLSRIALRDVRVQARDGKGVDIIVPSAVVEASLLGLALQGREAIDHVHVQGLDAKLRIDERGAARLVDRLVARPSGSVGEESKNASQTATEAEKEASSRDDSESDSESGAVSATWLLEASELAVRDAHGVLFTAQASRIEQSRDVLTADIRRIQLGNEASEAVKLQDVGVELVQQKGRHKLQRLEISEGAVFLPRHTALLASDDDASGEEPPADATLAAPTPKRVTLRRRLREARAPLAAPKAPSSPSPAQSRSDAGVDAGARDAGGAPAPVETQEPVAAKDTSDDDVTRASPGTEPSLHDRWLAPGGVIAWSGIQVAAHPGEDEDGSQVWVHDAEGRVHAPDAHELHLTGSGGTQDGGTLGWDVHLWPAEARARGQVDLKALPLGLVTPFLPAIPWHEPQRARVDARLEVDAESPDRLAVSGRLALQDAALAAPRIAPDPIEGISFRVTGKGHWLPLQRKLQVAESRFEMGEAFATVDGAVTWAADHYLFDLTASLPRTSCERAVKALPADLLGELSAFSWQGSMSAGLRAYIDSRALSETTFEIDVNEACEFVTVPMMADVTRFQMPFTHYVTEPDDEEFELHTGPGTPAWTPLDRISPFFVHAVLAHEDPTFFRHHGFVPPQIENAVAKNLDAGRYVVGASTISMQLVKNLFLHREKTLQRKIQEAFLTWWVEESLDKAQILELYLNVIEFGPEVYGIRNASRHYFNRSPNELSPGESVFLANILPNPKRYHDYFEQRSVPEHFKARMRRQMERMKRRGWYSPKAADYGMQELEDFQFHPNNGMLPPARVIPGDAAPLPYQVGYNPELDSGEWEWPLDGEPDEPSDAQGEPDDAAQGATEETETSPDDPSFSAATPPE